MLVPEFVQGCGRFAVFLQKYFEFQILWSLCSVDFFLSQSNFQFQLEFNLRFVVVLDTIPSQWCRNIFLKIYFFISTLSLCVLLHKPILTSIWVFC